MFVAGNNSKKGQTSLPLGSSAQLAGTTSALVQVFGDHGECLETTLSDIKKQEALFFKSK